VRINKESKSVDMEVRDINYILPQYIRSYLFYSKNEDPVEIVFPMFSSVPHPTKTGVRVPIRWVPELSEIAVEILKDGADVAEVTEEQIAKLDEKDEEIKRLREDLVRLRDDILQHKGETLPGDHPLVEEAKMITYESLAASLSPAHIPKQPEHLAKIDEKDEEIKRLRAELDSVKAVTEKVEMNPSGIPALQSASESIHKVEKVRYEAKNKQLEELAASVRVPKQPEHLAPEGSQLDNMSKRDREDLAKAKADLRDEPDVDESVEKPYTKKIKKTGKGSIEVEE
jgi:hypothetical protein